MIRDLYGVLHNASINEDGTYKYTFGPVIDSILSIASNPLYGGDGSSHPVIQLNKMGGIISDFHLCVGCENFFHRDDCFVCSNCRRDYFCSKKCQKEMWDIHKLVCNKPMACVYSSDGLRLELDDEKRQIWNRRERKMCKAMLTAERIVLSVMSEELADPETDDRYLKVCSPNSMLMTFMRETKCNGRVIYVTPGEENGVVQLHLIERKEFDACLNRLFHDGMKAVQDTTIGKYSESDKKAIKFECRYIAMVINILTHIDPNNFIVAGSCDGFVVCIKQIRLRFQQPGLINMGKPT